jgi:hypothetical protein
VQPVRKTRRARHDRIPDFLCVVRLWVFVHGRGTAMIWIFASVVLALAVHSDGFRKVLYACGIMAAIVVFTAICLIS